MFAVATLLRVSTPEEIRRLRAEGLSPARIAAHTNTTAASVRRLVGKLDVAAIRRQRETVARQINAEPLTWPEKVARWKQQTGKSEPTFRRTFMQSGLVECTKG